MNRFLTTVLSGMTPFELLYENSPTYLNLKIFGCVCFASTLKIIEINLILEPKRVCFLVIKMV